MHGQPGMAHVNVMAEWQSHASPNKLTEYLYDRVMVQHAHYEGRIQSRIEHKHNDSQPLILGKIDTFKPDPVDKASLCTSTPVYIDTQLDGICKSVCAPGGRHVLGIRPGAEEYLHGCRGQLPRCLFPKLRLSFLLGTIPLLGSQLMLLHIDAKQVQESIKS